MSEIVKTIAEMIGLKDKFGGDQKTVEKFLKEDETVTAIDDGYGGVIPSLRNVIKQMFDRIADITNMRDQAAASASKAAQHESDAETFANAASAAANGDVIHANAIIFPDLLDKDLVILEGQTALVGFKEISDNGSFEVLGKAEHI